MNVLFSIKTKIIIINVSSVNYFCYSALINALSCPYTTSVSVKSEIIITCVSVGPKSYLLQSLIVFHPSLINSFIKTGAFIFPTQYVLHKDCPILS